MKVLQTIWLINFDFPYLLWWVETEKLEIKVF